MNTYIFFEEGCEDNIQFEVKADSPNEAYDSAFEKYGPQVADLFYKQKHQ